jgi:hypothetical protein
MTLPIQSHCKAHGFPGAAAALEDQSRSTNPHPPTPASLAHILHPLLSIQNPSLIPSVYPLIIEGARHEITKCLVLGKRAGGTPVRLSLFGGLDPGAHETVDAAARLLTLLALGPAHAEDYAVFGYPCVNPSGFAREASPAAAQSRIAERWSSSPGAADCLFFRAEFQRIAPNGIIRLHSTGEAEGLRAQVNSALIAGEVVKPALLRLRNLVTVEDNPVNVLAEDAKSRRQRYHAGGLIPSPETQPWPFEIDLFAPHGASEEVRVQVLVLAVLDILRSYRAFSCHGGDL